MLQHFIRFLLGYLFGSLVWLIVVNPYKHYYDFTHGYYWPQVAFALAISLLFMASLSARTTMALFLPNMIGGATQNYIVVLLLTALLMNPLASVGFNSVESARVIGCSLTLTFDQLSERAKLVLSPILQILNDKSQADLEPIRQDLARIQQFVGQLRQNAQLVGAPAPADQSGRPSPPPPPPPTVPVNRNGGPTSKTGIELEWDAENFGVKANVDMERLRQLAKSGKLKQVLGHDLSKGVNLTELLYASCLKIFEAAKRECSNSVRTMYDSCQQSIGPYLATWWCAPFSQSLDAFCPWIMDQLVDEKTLCRQVKIVGQAGGGGGVRAIKLANNRTVDVNEAFGELGKQMARLNQHILLDESAPTAAGRPNRLEIHLTFNEQTRRLFQTTKSVIEFIGNKYKMRRLLITALLFTYDAYTTYTFLLILTKAWHYQRRYLADIKFDNCYITSDFKRLDAALRARSKRLASGLGERPWVLPLSREEERHYISTFACRRRTSEERQVQRLSLTIAAIFLAFALSLLYVDNIFYSLLASIHDHSLVRFKQLGHHQLDVRVRGDGVVGRLVRKLTAQLDTVYNLDRYTSTRQCLPESRRTPAKFYLRFAALVALYFLIDQISIYAMRLRRATCAAFHPEKERQRVEFLHKLIQFKRSRARAGAARAKLAGLDETLAIKSA